MSSWFSTFESATEALNNIGEKLGEELPSFETASEAFNKIGDNLGDLQSKVKDAIPTVAVDNDLINKITLRSDELLREHELLDAQEKRKELVKEYLSELLPWETKDESKEILVEQCQEAILKLSQEKESFETPFMLEKGEMFNPDYYTEVNFENMNEVADDEKTDSSPSAEADAADATADATRDQKKEVDVGDSMTPEQKLEKMQPLPLLLEHFDIDTHVGLIERVLKEDENLVHMHSLLSGELNYLQLLEYCPLLNLF